MNVNVRASECTDVARLLSYAAERPDIHPQYSSLMKRGASLLIQLSALCTMLISTKEVKQTNEDI